MRRNGSLLRAAALGAGAALAILATARAAEPAVEALYAAVQAGDPTAVATALEDGAGPARQKSGELSPLSIVAHTLPPRGDQIAHLLLRAGAPVDDLGGDIETPLATLVIGYPLHRSSRNIDDRESTAEERLRLLKVLLAAGAHPNVLVCDKPLSFILAEQWAKSPTAAGPAGAKFVARLASAGMDVDATYQGKSAVQLMESHGTPDTPLAKTMRRFSGRPRAKIPEPFKVCVPIPRPPA